MFVRQNYWPVVEAEAERRIAHRQETENARMPTRQPPSSRSPSAEKWAVMQDVIKDFQLDSEAFRKATLANAAALAKKAEELERAGRERFERTDYEAALNYVRQALALHQTDSRKRFALHLAGLVHMDDWRTLPEVPRLDDVMRYAAADHREKREAPDAYPSAFQTKTPASWHSAATPEAERARRGELEAAPCQVTAHCSERPTSWKTAHQRIFEFIDAHQGCLTRDITRYMKKNVRKYLDEMDRTQLIVRVTKRDGYACGDGREKRHYTADVHVGHIGRYGGGE